VTVGKTVARARTAAGMTVAQVADATRIRATVVTAIENDDFRLCGGDVYARGHLKSIATSVGIDPVALAAQFDTEHGTTREITTSVEPIIQPTRMMESGPNRGLGSLAGSLGATVDSARRGPNWSALMALTLALVVGVGAVSFLAQRGGSSSPTATSPTVSSSPSQSSSPSSTPATEPSSSPSPTPSATNSDVVAAADSVTVVLDVTGKASWVRVTGGTAGKTLYEGTLNQGDTKTFRDDSLVKLVVGNAGAVSLKVNGQELGEPGGKGQVVKLSFGPGDPTGASG
jgi:cytoskeletal protein RodZ